MKPSSCASPSRAPQVLVLVLVLAANAAKPTPAPATESVPNAPVPGSVVNLEFTNGTSKASVVVDLASTDVHIEMRTRPKADSSRDSKAPSTRSEAAAADPKALPGTAPVAATQAATDSVTRLVVAGIRRGQDHLLRGEHERARQETEATLALRPTAEAHALAGSIRWVTGDRPGARLQWQEALRLDPTQPGVADMLARTEPGAPAPEPPKAPIR